MKISVIGLGWYGEELARELLKQGHEVHGSSRDPEKVARLRALGIKAQVFSYPQDIPETLRSAEIIVLNIPPMEGALAWFEEWKLPPECWVIFISSTGNSPRIAEQEHWIQTQLKNWTILRFGGLLGGNRHPGKSLSGRHNLPGRWWPVNLLHRDDAVAVTCKVIELKLKHDIFPVVSSEHPTREEFYQEYCRQKGLPLPTFDQNDQTRKEIISNDKIRQYYPQFHPLNF